MMTKRTWSSAVLILLGLAFALMLGLTTQAAAQGAGGKKAVTDIKVADIYVDKKDCRLWVTYQNVGTTTITATLRERTSVQNVVVEDDMMAFNLPPGQYFGHGVGADPGYKLFGVNKTVTTMIDVDNVLPEINEANNTLTKTLTCSLITPSLAIAKKAAGQPDLVSHLNFTVVHEGDDASGHYVTFNANITVSNIGTIGAGPFDVLLEYRINDQGPWLVCGACKMHVTGVAAGQYKQLDPRQFTKRGTQTSGQAIFFRATADCDNVIAESNETNNVYSTSYQSEPLHK
jgi:hypothetical protein